MAAGGQKLNFDIISAQNSPFDLDKIWQADTTQPQEQAYEIIFDLSQNPRWPPRPPLWQNMKSVIT